MTSHISINSMTTMTKGPTKDKITISIDKELHAKLKKYCAKRLIKLSTYIEHLVREGHDK